MNELYTMQHMLAKYVSDHQHNWDEPPADSDDYGAFSGSKLSV